MRLLLLNQYRPISLILSIYRSLFTLSFIFVKKKLSHSIVGKDLLDMLAIKVS